MTKVNQVYKCDICGNIVIVLHSGGGQLVCCGEAMNLQKENTVDASIEKHIPVVKKTKEGYLVNVGKIEHPMSVEHYIEWIELITPNYSYRNFLKPGDKPLSKFCTSEDLISVRAYCNLHGLWKQ